jgi:nucleotide-binding universal stress UspA family protein
VIAVWSAGACRGCPGALRVAGGGFQVVGCEFDGSPESRRALRWASSLTLAASARLRVLSVYESTRWKSLAVGGWLATTSINEAYAASSNRRLLRR